MRPVYLFSTSTYPGVISVKSLDITLLQPQINFSDYDHFIITSKQVSRALKQYDNAQLKPALCISSKTADSYTHIGGTVLHTGSGYGDDITQYIAKYPKSVRWLYLRAKVVASNFVSLAKSQGYSIEEYIVYESVCSREIKNIVVEDNATLIFTSPSSVKCYLQNNKLSAKAKVIVIGKTTAKSLPNGMNYLLSEEKTIESCLELI